jgi:hypothetical protein
MISSIAKAITRKIFILKPSHSQIIYLLYKECREISIFG